MSEELEEDQRTVITFSASSLNTLKLCARQYKFSAIDQWTPILSGDRIEMGSYLHSLLEAYYKAKMSLIGSVDIEKIIYEGHAQLQEETFLDPEEVVKVEVLFREYCDFYENEDWTPKFVEQAFTKVMFEDEHYVFAFQGKADLGVRTRFHELLVVDHKLRGAFRRVPYLSSQTIGYAWAFDTPNIMLNQIGDQSTYDVKDRMKRTLLSYPTSIVEEWVLNTISWIKQMIVYHRDDFYPYNDTSCDKMSGCFFKSVCVMPPKSREWKIQQICKKKTHKLFTGEDNE